MILVNLIQDMLIGNVWQIPPPKKVCFTKFTSHEMLSINVIGNSGSKPSKLSAGASKSRRLRTDDIRKFVADNYNT